MKLMASAGEQCPHAQPGLRAVRRTSLLGMTILSDAGASITRRCRRASRYQIKSPVDIQSPVWVQSWREQTQNTSFVPLIEIRFSLASEPLSEDRSLFHQVGQEQMI